MDTNESLARARLYVQVMREFSGLTKEERLEIVAIVYRSQCRDARRAEYLETALRG